MSSQLYRQPEVGKRWQKYDFFSKKNGDEVIHRHYVVDLDILT